MGGGFQMQQGPSGKGSRPTVGLSVEVHHSPIMFGSQLLLRSDRALHHGFTRGACVCSAQSKSLGLVSWFDREKACHMSAVRLMHERELFGGRVRAVSLADKPVMRRSVICPNSVPRF